MVQNIPQYIPESEQAWQGASTVTATAQEGASSIVIHPGGSCMILSYQLLLDFLNHSPDATTHSLESLSSGMRPWPIRSMPKSNNRDKALNVLYRPAPPELSIVQYMIQLPKRRKI